MWQCAWPARRSSHDWAHGALMVMLALSVVLMHGLGMSHTEPVESVAAPALSAHAVLGSASEGGHAGLAGSEAAQSGEQEHEPGHAETMARACLAVLSAVVFAAASFLVVRRSWRWGEFPLFAVRSQRPSIRPVPVHPRTHLCCVMRS